MRGSRLISIFLVLLWSSAANARPHLPGNLWDGLEVQSIVSSQNLSRVWWVTSGPHAVRPADDNNNGIPDFVEWTAEETDAVFAKLQNDGWLLPLDDTLLLDAETAGPDGLLDIYIVNFDVPPLAQLSALGQVTREGCYPDGAAETGCVSFVTIHHDFTRGINVGYYESQRQALKDILVHELFHVTHNTYRSQHEAWWIEGTATWFTRALLGPQKFFTQYTSFFFENYQNPLNELYSDRSQYKYFYSTALFPYLMSLIYGDSIIREIYEKRERDPITAIALVLDEKGSSLREMFDLFATWNLLTGSRNIEGEGYPEAPEYPAITPLTLNGSDNINWNVEMPRLSARYAQIRPERRVRVSLPEDSTLSLIAVDLNSEVFSQQVGEVILDEGSNWALIASNGSLEATTGQIQIRNAPAPVEPEPDPEPEPGPEPEPETPQNPEDSNEGCSHTGGTALPSLLSLLAITRRRRR